MKALHFHGTVDGEVADFFVDVDGHGRIVGDNRSHAIHVADPVVSGHWDGSALSLVQKTESGTITLNAHIDSNDMLVGEFSNSNGSSGPFQAFRPEEDRFVAVEGRWTLADGSDHGAVNFTFIFRPSTGVLRDSRFNAADPVYGAMYESNTLRFDQMWDGQMWHYAGSETSPGHVEGSFNADSGETGSFVATLKNFH
jgi:hypothetical protein